jgi:hypothetical protein
MGKDYYKILGIHPDSSEEEIKEAYRRKAHRYHPDKGQGDEGQFKEAHEAYEVLGNPTNRAEYDGRYKQSSNETKSTHPRQDTNTANSSQYQKSDIRKVIEIFAFLIGVGLIYGLFNRGQNNNPSTNLNSSAQTINSDASGASGLPCLALDGNCTNNSPTTNDQPSGLGQSVQLPVTVLPTDDGISGSGVYADKYSSEITVTGDSQLINKLAAYGAGYGVQLGLKGWTGSGSVGADGTSSISLHPAVLQPSQIGQKISYYYIPACVGCMYDSAAPYFSSAMQEHNKENYGSPVTIPQGLEVTPISSTLITYTLPDNNGLSTRGVVYYYPGDQTHDPDYADAEFVLPVGDTDLLNFLVQDFISRGKYQ